jgi:hypothetical protein
MAIDVPAVPREGVPAMATQLRTSTWSTWTIVFVLLILILAMVYLAY